MLSLRSALVFLLAAISGVTAGALCWLAEGNAPRGVLAGLSAFGLSLPLLNRLIAAETVGSTCGEEHGHG
ncbi:hypothetical protein ACFV6Z_25420 [Streptomyces sp. NPDC059818]|uniref:hypothetical protein n=1 Tax=Streptomyces sp. NPDC059818 TaxID=3346962 RepID=UPI00365F8613